MATVAYLGLEARAVEVQCQLSSGVPSFRVVGLPDKAVGESRERVHSALAAMGLSLPPKRITVNLSPADLPKEGSHYDLPIALALLGAMGVVDREALADHVAVGELALDGRVIASPGVLLAALHAGATERGLICPAAQGTEASWAGTAVIATPDLIALLNHLKGTRVLPAPAPGLPDSPPRGPDLKQVKGQETARRALEIAAAGGHNLLILCMGRTSVTDAIMKAITYARWSSLEQKNSTSPSRQHELNKIFCARMNWEVVESLTDSGLSAWNGDNIRTGELGRFVERTEKIRADDIVLVVEKLDRLSRQPPLVMTNWLQRATATGLTIATADGRHSITLDALMTKPLDLMNVIFEAFRGFDESQAKSVRVAEAWSQKRVRGAPMTKRCPAWLQIADKATHFRNADNLAARYEPIPDRVAIVQRIFNMTEAGKGKSAIAAMLNSEGVPVFGRGDGWHASYIQKMIRSEAVIGRYQPHTKPKGGKRLPAGDPLDDYYYPIITPAQFARVNDSRASRVLAQQSGYAPLANILTGLAHCHTCGATMTMRNSGVETLANGQTVERRYLKCSRAVRMAKGCSNTFPFRYELVENTILDKLLHLAMDDQHFADRGSMATAENNVATLRTRLSDVERRMTNAWNMLEEDSADEKARTRYRELKADANTIRTSLNQAEEALTEARGMVSPEEHITRVSDVRQMMNDPDDDVRYRARSLVKLALNDLLDDVMFSGRKRRVGVNLKNRARMFAFSAVDGTESYDLLENTKNATDAALVGYHRRMTSDVGEAPSQPAAPVDRLLGAAARVLGLARTSDDQAG